MLLSSPFHIRAVVNHSQKGRLNLSWFTLDIVDWYLKYMNNYWEHDFLKRKFHSKSLAFFMLLNSHFLGSKKYVYKRVLMWKCPFFSCLFPFFLCFVVYFLSLYFCPHSVHSENAELTFSYNFSAPSPMTFLFLSKLICLATWSPWNLAIIQYIKPRS